MANSCSNFISYHSHSSASLLDGLGRVEEILHYAAEIGAPGHCLTDHGVTTGIFSGWPEARKVAAEFGRPFRFFGGVEAYLVEDRTQPPPKRTRKAVTGGLSAEQEENTGDEIARQMPSRCHLTLLIKNEEGYRNMMAIIWDSNRNGCTGGYGRWIPRSDLALLAAHHEGLICLTGCVSGPVAARVLNHNVDGARQLLRQLRQIFGEDLYVEVMPTSYKDQRPANKGCLRLADELAVSVVATNDAHWIRREDADTHEVLCCIQSKSKMAELPRDQGGKRFRLSDRCYWLHSRYEMEEDFQTLHGDYLSVSEVSRYLDNSLEIADKITFNGPQFQPTQPRLRVPYERAQRFQEWRSQHGVATRPEFYQT